MEARKRCNPGSKVPHFAEPVLGLAEGETRGLHAGYVFPTRRRVAGGSQAREMI